MKHTHEWSELHKPVNMLPGHVVKTSETCNICGARRTHNKALTESGRNWLVRAGHPTTRAFTRGPKK